MIKYVTVNPPLDLNKYIRCFWFLESDQPYTHRSMADVGAEMVFHYYGQFDELLSDGRKEKSFTSGIQGAGTLTRRFQIGGKFGIFGIYFYPGAINRLFDVPDLEIVNGMTDLKSFLGQEGGILEEKIFVASSNEERVTIASSYFCKLLSSRTFQEDMVGRSVRYIMEQKGLVGLDALTQKVCLSERQFERRFKNLTGFTPKLFCRVVRFHSAFKDYDSGLTLTEIAYKNGFYDQSHFIKDFREFSGYNPKEFFSGKADEFGWLMG